MTINYLILAHTKPVQVKKLVVALNQENTRFYVHVDLKTNLAPFLEALSEFSNLHLLPEDQRETCHWGGIGIVKATLTMLKLVEENGEKGYVVLLSGQDYPVKSKEYIATYFQNNNSKDFISWFPLPAPRWTRGGLDRLDRYKINLSNKKGDFILLPTVHSREFFTFECLKKLMKLISRMKVRELGLLFNKKTFPTYLKPYGGDTWWSLRTDTTSKILTYIRQHKDLLTYMTYSKLPDEMIFQSIILEITKGNLDKPQSSLTYANWSGNDENSPRTFTPEDLPRLKNLSPDFLFARKFDLELFPKLLDRIEQEVWNCQGVKNGANSLN